MLLTAAQLADRLQVSRARVSQYVSEGKLSGCYQGEGRARRFDLAKATAALKRNLDAGQMMGNGATTRRALQGAAPVAPAPAPSPASRDGSLLRPEDPDRYELARTAKAEEEARRLRRQNAEAEGTMVLASVAAQQAARLIAQEIAEVEAMLRDAARDIADQMQVDFKTARKILLDRWRSHRGTRAAQLEAQAEAAPMTAAEQAENF